MKKRMYAKPVLAHLGNLYQLTAGPGPISEFFDQSLGSLPSNV